MKYCSELNNVLTFFPDRIQSCCIISTSGPCYINKYDGNIKNINFNDFIKIKKFYYDALESELLDNSPCKNCLYLKEKNQNDKFSEQFNIIYLNNWIHCNCRCFYCDRHIYERWWWEGIGSNYTKKKIKSKYYDVLPIIKGLYNNNLLDRKNLRVVFHGGDLSVLKEFEPLVKEFIKQGVNRFDFSSNNIIFQPLIYKLLKQNKATLTMSLDSGTKETYKRIKGVDKFNNVIKNLKHYIKASKSNSPDLIVKYILLKNMNDNEEEIKAFINLMINIGIKRVTLHLEHWYTINILEKGIPIYPHFRNLIKLFLDLCKENNLYYDIPDNIMQYIMTKE